MTQVSDEPEVLVRKIRRLGINSSVYFLGTILTQALQFFLIPLYTRYLTPADYGILTVAGTVISLSTLVFGTYLAGAVSRGYFNVRSEEELRKLIGTITMFLLLAPSMLAIALDLYGQHGKLELFAAVRFRPYLRLALWTGYFSVFLTVVSAAFGAAQRPVPASLLTIGSTLTMIVLSLVLVVYLRRGAAGNLEAQLLAAVLWGAVSVGLLLRQGGVHFDRRVLFSSLRFALPFLPHLLANWAINLSDRFILQSSVSLGDIGIYSLACQIAAIAMVATSAINSALSPLLLQQLRDGQHAHVRLLGTYGLLAMTFCCLGTALLGGEAIHLLTPASFHGGANLVPWIVGAYLFQGVYFVWSIGTWHSMRTALLPLCTIAAAATNIGLNLWLVPHYGIWAAAVTTLIAYAVLMLAHGLLAQWLYPIAWEYRRWLGMIAAAAACFVAGVLVARGGLAFNIAVKSLVLLILFPGLLLMSGFLRREEWIELRGLLSKLRRA
jgi:O-antigen/teichoic acid export membrane protein